MKCVLVAGIKKKLNGTIRNNIIEFEENLERLELDENREAILGTHKNHCDNLYSILSKLITDKEMVAARLSLTKFNL